MSVYAGPEIVSTDILLALDAANAKCYPGTGTSATDLVQPFGFTLTNNPVYTANNGGAFIFNNVDDSRITSSRSTFLSFGANSFSLEAVVNLVDYSGGSIIQKGSTVNGNGEYTLSFNSSGLRLMLSSNGSASTFYQSGYVLETGVWYHVIATKSGTTADFYVNGLFVNTASVISTTHVGTAAVGIGAGPFGGFNTNSTIPLAKIYNKALSSQEAWQNFSAVRGRYGI